MRHLLTALCLLPTLVLAQELHTFKNGEVADAQKINENFDALMLQLAAGRHPEGDIQFSYTDTISSTTFTGLFTEPNKVYEYATELNVEVFREDFRVIQQGIPFYARRYVRFFPIFFSVDLPFCPGAIAAVPVQIYTTYFNNLGGILVGTAWDWGEEIGPTADNVFDNPTGSYICLTSGEDGLLGKASYYNKSFGGTGRYRCAAVTPPERIEEVVPLNAEDERVSVSIGEVNGEPTSSVGIITSSSFVAALSTDVPAECEQSRDSLSRSPALPQSLHIFGLQIQLPEEITASP